MRAALLLGLVVPVTVALGCGSSKETGTATVTVTEARSANTPPAAAGANDQTLKPVPKPLTLNVVRRCLIAAGARIDSDGVKKLPGEATGLVAELPNSTFLAVVFGPDADTASTAMKTMADGPEFEVSETPDPKVFVSLAPLSGDKISPEDRATTAKCVTPSVGPAPGASSKRESTSPQSGQTYRGNGTKNIGTIVVGQDSTLKWTTSGSRGQPFSVTSDDAGILVSSSETSGESAVAAGTHPGVTVLAVGDWEITVVPDR